MYKALTTNFIIFVLNRPGFEHGSTVLEVNTLTITSLMGLIKSGIWLQI